MMPGDTSLFSKFLESSPYWGPFLVAFAMTLGAGVVVLKLLLKVLISNGLTSAVNRLSDRLEDMPDKVGAQVALKLLEHRVISLSRD
jgi:hypothetical protein